MNNNNYTESVLICRSTTRLIESSIRPLLLHHIQISRMKIEDDMNTLPLSHSKPTQYFHLHPLWACLMEAVGCGQLRP